MNGVYIVATNYQMGQLTVPLENFVTNLNAILNMPNFYSLARTIANALVVLMFAMIKFRFIITDIFTATRNANNLGMRLWKNPNQHLLQFMPDGHFRSDGLVLPV
jgi:hypothetical protein